MSVARLTKYRLVISIYILYIPCGPSCLCCKISYRYTSWNLDLILFYIYWAIRLSCQRKTQQRTRLAPTEILVTSLTNEMKDPIVETHPSLARHCRSAGHLRRGLKAVIISAYALKPAGEHKLKNKNFIRINTANKDAKGCDMKRDLFHKHKPLAVFCQV